MAVGQNQGEGGNGPGRAQGREGRGGARPKPGRGRAARKEKDALGRRFSSDKKRKKRGLRLRPFKSRYCLDTLILTVARRR